MLGLLAPGCSSPPCLQERAWVDRIRSALYLPHPLPRLAPELRGRSQVDPQVYVEKVTYGTQFGLRVPALLYLPASVSGPVPGLVVVNGHGGDKYSWYSYYAGILYARAGAAVLTYDPIGEGERNAGKESGTRAHDAVQGPAGLACRMSGLMITDVLQAVSYLAQRPEVDPRRIGALGYSLGSFVLGLAGAVDGRLRACVLAGGGNLDGPGGYWDRSKPMCQGLPYQSLLPLGDRPAVLYALHASRGPALIVNGLQDQVVRVPANAQEFFDDLRARAARLRGTSEGLFETVFEPGAGHRPYFLGRRTALWLQRHLDFPNWTETTIGRLPEGRVGEWARARGAALDPRYAVEHHEGGMMALGEDIPVLSRADLSVFSPEEWERRKSDLILESWLTRVKAGGNP